MADSPSVARFIQPRSTRGGIAQAILDVVGQVPAPRAGRRPASPQAVPGIVRRATLEASGIAGTMALAPGPLGWLTIAPELYAVWRLQVRMVADIAACHGRRPTREEMLFCLFQHTAAGAFRELVIQVGERYVVRRTPLSAMYAIANKIALRVAQRGLTRVGTRWLPLAGAVAVAGFVLLDTRRVAATARMLFSSPVRYEDAAEVELLEPVVSRPRKRRRKAQVD